MIKDKGKISVNHPVRTNRKMSDVIESMRSTWLKKNGSFVSEEMAAKIVDDIRKELRKKRDI